MTYTFRPAQRSEAKPLIGLYAESGAGKTYSALLLARGFVGAQGRIGMIETESGRGEAFSDPTEYPELRGPGASNYDVLSLRDTFSPQAYGQAITAAEQASLDALIIDSASHEWEGAGGVLQMAAAEQGAGKRGVLVWQQPKMEHQRHFMLRFMQTPIPLVILCMRAKYPMKEVPKQNGRGKEWVRSDALEPKQADDILFEMFVHGWISQGDHAFRLTKSTSKALEPVFADGKPITLDTGRQLAEWARGAGASSDGQPAPSSPDRAVEIARDVAGMGTEAFRRHWSGLPTVERNAIRPIMDELKETAAEADAVRAADDPFGLPPLGGEAKGAAA